MPVIGRLDSQVNDVLIEPVGQRRGRDEGEQPDDSRRVAPDVEARGAEEAHERMRYGTERRKRNQTRGEQLPVWLL
jgi:hypothetical protein